MLGVLGPSLARAACPEPYDMVDCTPVIEGAEDRPDPICQFSGGGTLLICDLGRNGLEGEAVAWAVLNEGDAVCDENAEYCIFGTPSIGGDFCCEMNATEDLFALHLYGTDQRRDYLYFNYTDENVDVDLDNWDTTTIDVFEGEAYGRSSGDYIEGSRVVSMDYRDQLFGDSGADEIFGLAGSDEIFGGDGADAELNGGDGIDTIYGQADDDLLVGEAGNDTLWGGDGIDTLVGGSGHDTLNGENHGDFLLGGSGDDTLSGDVGDDELSGGSGTDNLSGGADADKLCGDDDDNDTLSGGDGNDYLWGGAGTGDSGNGNGHSGAPGDTCDSGTTESLSGCEVILSVSRPCTVGP